MRSQKLVSQIGYEWCSTTSGQEINIIKRHKQYDSRNANKSTAPQIDTAFIYFRNFNTVITANVFFIPLHFTKTMEPGWNSIFDSAKTSGPHGIVCFNCSQSCSLHRLFFRHSCAGRDRSLCTAAITNLASCVWLKTSMPSMNNIFVWLGKSRYWIIWSELSQAPSRLSGTAPAGKLRSNI